MLDTEAAPQGWTAVVLSTQKRARNASFLSLIASCVVLITAWTLKNRKNKIQEAARELGAPYQIDFVTEHGLPEYLALIEEEITRVSVVAWPLAEPPKSGAPQGD